MEVFNLNNLALGGAVAALVGFWGQFKNSIRYLSSFLVVQVSFHDTPTASAVLNHLKLHYRVVPSGLVNVYAINAYVNSVRSWRLVPFRTVNTTTIFYRGHQCLVATLNGDTLQVYGVRGTFDYRVLCNSALDNQQELWDNTNSSSGRFFLEKVIGTDKGPWAGLSHLKGSSATSNDAPIAGEVTSGSVTSLVYPQLAIDLSFKYSKDEYRLVEKDDPFRALFFDESVNDHVQEAKQWLQSKQWYAERSIPWKRGWLIHGPGGTGKSSLSLALAKSLNIPIYQYFLATLSDQEFIGQWSRMQVPSIALFEDFDTVFDKRVPLTEHKSLTFDCVLNVISGVSAIDGVFLIVTTNHIDKVDEALGVVSSHGTISTRPGRIDQVIHLGLTTEDIRWRQVKHILKNWPEYHERLVQEGEGMTPVQFQELCLGVAYKELESHASGTQ